MTPENLKPRYDAVIVGAGAAGLSCALGIVRNWRDSTPPHLLVISKLQPLRSHTGSAEGGIAASLGNIEPDTWQWHYRDTVKGGDWLVDQDAAAVLAREAPATVIRLEHDGVAFSRTQDGHIAQRRFGGHTANGERPVKRVAYAADRIGHQILHTLWQQCQRYDIDFADEWYVTDLVLTEETGAPSDAPTRRQAAGIVAFNEADGALHEIAARNVVIATGGAGRLFHTTSNSWDLTGDGMGLSLAAGLQLEDSEFIQFHPTGLAHTGILLSEAARGEGGTLRNCNHEAFMHRYAPGAGDLAARDVVARAINREVAEGRGVPDPTSPDSPDDCVWLDLTSIGKSRLETSLPEVCDTIAEFTGLDPATDLIPVKPTAHYTMGGIPITLDGAVYTLDSDRHRHVIRGLKAAGECSCVSVHGANRLGANSLLDAIVFGTRTGASIASEGAANVTESLAPSPPTADATEPAARAKAQNAALHAAFLTRSHTLERLTEAASTTDDDNPYQLMRDLGSMMETHLGVSCDSKSITEAIDLLKADFVPRSAALRTHSSDPSYNQELCAILEARNLVSLALTLATASLARRESRGSLYRSDFPTRDDDHFLAHSYVDAAGIVRTNPVVISDFPPQKRSY